MLRVSTSFACCRGLDRSVQALGVELCVAAPHCVDTRTDKALERNEPGIQIRSKEEPRQLGSKKRDSDPEFLAGSKDNHCNVGPDAQEEIEKGQSEHHSTCEQRSPKLEEERMENGKEDEQVVLALVVDPVVGRTPPEPRSDTKQSVKSKPHRAKHPGRRCPANLGRIHPEDGAGVDTRCRRKLASDLNEKDHNPHNSAEPVATIDRKTHLDAFVCA